MLDNNENLIKRLKLLMKEADTNALELAERAGVGRSFVYDILSGKSKNPTTHKLTSIAKVLGTNLSYLISGEDDPASNVGTMPDLTAISSIHMNGDTMDTGKQYFFHKYWIEHTLHANAEDLRVVFVSGDAMAPTLLDRDMVLINTKDVIPQPSGVFVISDGLGLPAKRIELIGTKPNIFMRLISDNKKYSHLEVKPMSTDNDRPAFSGVKILGRVIWFSRTVL